MDEEPIPPLGRLGQERRQQRLAGRLLGQVQQHRKNLAGGSRAGAQQLAPARQRPLRLFLPRPKFRRADQRRAAQRPQRIGDFHQCDRFPLAFAPFPYFGQGQVDQRIGGVGPGGGPKLLLGGVRLAFGSIAGLTIERQRVIGAPV